MRYLIISIFILMLIAPLASARGEFLFDLAAKVQGDNNYVKHWSNTYPPDPKADIIIYTAAINMSYKRLSALGFVYVVYDPQDNIVAVEKISSFKRSYDPNVVYYTLHPKTDWLEGNYKVKIIVFDMVDREAFDERVAKDPFAIGIFAIAILIVFWLITPSESPSVEPNPEATSPAATEMSAPLPTETPSPAAPASAPACRRRCGGARRRSPPGGRREALRD